MPMGWKKSVRILVPASGRGLDGSHISDWVTGLSPSQPWPAEMGVVVAAAAAGGLAEWGLGRCRALTRADRTAKCQRVSLSLLLCLMRSPFSHLVASCLDILLTIYRLTGPQRQCQSSSQVHNEWIHVFFCCCDGVFIFFRCSSEH